MMRKSLLKSIFCLYCLLVACNEGFAQEQKMDSLYHELRIAKKDTTRVSVLIALGESYIYSNTDSAEKYLNDALYLSEVLSYPYGQAVSYRDLGYYYVVVNNWPKAMASFAQGKKIAEEINNLPIIFNCSMAIGVDYKNKGQYESALRIFLRALEIAERLDDQFKIASACNDVGNMYFEAGNYEKSLEYERRAERIFKKFGGNENRLSVVLMNIGNVFFQNNEKDSALQYYEESLQLLDTQGVYVHRATLLSNIAGVYAYKEDNEMAMAYYKKALDLGEESGNPKNVITAKLAIGKLLLKKGAQEKAKRLTLEAVELCEANQPRLKDLLGRTYQDLSELYAELGEYQSAFQYYKRFHSVVDTLVDRDVVSQLAEMETKYKVKEKERLLELSQKETELTRARARYQLLLSLLILVLAFVGVLIYFRSKRKKFEDELSRLRAAAQERQADDKHQLATAEATSTVQPASEKMESITVSVGDKIILIKLENISFFTAEDRYIFLHDDKGKRYIVDYTLATIEKKLPASFLRIHRSFIINRENVEEIRKTYNGKFLFFMKGAKDIRVGSSRKYAEIIRKTLEI